MAYPEPHYTITGQAALFPEYSSVAGTTLLAKNQDGNWGYISASNLQTTLDGDGLATDADIVAVSASIAAVAASIGVSGSYSTQAIFYATDNGNGTNFKVGDDAWVGDVNAVNTIQVSGVQNADRGYIKFGSGSNTPTLGYGGTNNHIDLSSVLKLAQLDPLPTGTVGSLAVSGSSLYFHNGSGWGVIS